MVYQIEQGDGLHGRLADLGPVEVVDGRVERTWYDTFDWRLYRSGQVLEQDRRGGDNEARWRRLGDGGLEASFSDAVPRFARELRPGPLRDRLRATIDVRALLPVSTAQCEQTQFTLTNADRKVVARLRTEAARLPDRDPIHLLTVEPVPGYPEPAARIRRLLEGELNLVPTDQDLFFAAVAATGRQPGDYTARLRVDLEATMRSGAAARRILGQLLEKVLVNLDGVRDDTDIEFLHDLRTAVRRTRSALGQFKRVLHPRLADRLARELRWVGQLTTPVRDLDVHQLDFEEVWPSYEPELYAALQPVGDLLVGTRALEREKLLIGLDSARFAGVLEIWRSLLNHSDPPRSLAPQAEQPVCWLAARRIRKLHKRMRAEGGAIQADTPDEAVHDLRKLGKKFRYAIEMFQTLYPEPLVKPALRGLKNLQDVLGRFNDLSVQQDSFRGWAEMLSARPGSGNALLAMGQLVERLRREQGEVRAAFQQRFAAFDARDVRRKLAALGKTPKLS